jgi:SAM-dependent methyltransferase
VSSERGGRRRPRTPGPAPRGDRPPVPERSAAHERFLRLDRERALREWQRYEGTAQRELFRQLRERFLLRHAVPGRWALDLGSGPGRFSPLVGGVGATTVALDLSREMLRVGRELGGAPALRGARPVETVQGDAASPPFPEATFAEVALVGNALGFEAGSGERLLDAAERLTAPGGRLLLEIAPGPGERSRYLARLPAGAVRRLLAAPPAAVAPRVLREGFRAEPVRHRSASFRRWTASELADRWRASGWRVEETVAVAPALGAEPERLAEVARDAKAWERLRELEERLGRAPERWPSAAAVLVAVRRPPLSANDFDGERTSFRP